MSEFFVVTEPRPRRSARARAARDAMAPPPSPLGASSVSHSQSQSQSASSDSHSPSLLNNRGVSVVHEVTDRELFATAVAVVPNLQTLLTRRSISSRRRDSNSSAHRGFTSASAPAASGKNNLHWVVKKKRHGLEIKEFDRGSLAHSGLSAATRSSNASAASQTPRSAAAFTPRTLRTPRWCQFNRAAAADSEHMPPVPPSFASTRGSITTSDHPSAHRHPQQQQCWPHCDERVAFAASAHAELGCRLSEALELLFSTDALQFDATMSSLFGHTKYKRGDLLLAHALPHGLSVTPSDLDAVTGNPHVSSTSSHSSSIDEHKLGGAFDWLERDDSLVEPTQPGWVALQSVTLRPRLNVSLPAAALRKHKLSFAAYSQTRPARDEAVYVMRTLPRELQMRVNATSEFAEASGGDVVANGEAFVDEISIGYHLAGSYSDMSGHQTRITMCAYVSTPEIDAAGSHDGGFEHDDDGEAGTPHSHHSFLTRHHHNRQLRRRSECSASAKYVVSLLAAATNDLEKLLRRRRLGSQAFILTPLDKSVFQQHECHVCARRFGLLRAELFCQLCGHLVCRDCSRKFEVEPVARRVRRNRVCFACVAHVDASGVVKGESEDVGEYWTRPRHRVRRERRRSGRRADGNAEEEERVPAFLSARGGRSATASSMWNVFKTHDKDAGESGTAELDALGSRRLRRAFSMDYVDAGGDIGEVNDVDDIVDVVDNYHHDPDTATDYPTRGRRRTGSGGSMTTFSGTELNSSTTPPLTPGRQLADALFSGNPLSRARALEVVRRVVQQVTQQSDGSTLDCEDAGSETCELDAQQQATSSSSSAADRAMLRKYLEARRRLASIANWKTSTEVAATDGSCRSTPMSFPDESMAKRDASGVDNVCKAPTSAATSAPQESKKKAKAKAKKKIDLLSRPWEFRLDAARPPARSQTHISSATETDDDDEEVEDASFTSPAPPAAPSASLDGVCEVAAARLNCPMAYVVSLEHQSLAKASIVGAFEASSVRHALSDRTTALCSVASAVLSSSYEPVVVPNPLENPAFRLLGEDAGMRFFAGFPIRVAPSDGETEWGGAPVAWLCAADAEPRDCVTLDDYAAMQALAKLVADLLEQQQRPVQA